MRRVLSWRSRKRASTPNIRAQSGYPIIFPLLPFVSVVFRSVIEHPIQPRNEKERSYYPALGSRSGATRLSCSPLHMAALTGNLGAVEMLLDYGAKPESRMHKRRLTPLHLAAMWVGTIAA